MKIFLKIQNFSWTFCGIQYVINWPAVILIGGTFVVVGLLQHFGVVG